MKATENSTTWARVSGSTTSPATSETGTLERYIGELR